jgi:hypothetical protein
MDENIGQEPSNQPAARPLMSNGQLAAIIGAGAIAVIALASPGTFTSMLYAVFGKPADQQCLDVAKSWLSFKDPDSVTLIGDAKMFQGTITIDYKATNSYGAYVSDSFQCVYDNGMKASPAQMRRIVEASTRR